MSQLMLVNPRRRKRHTARKMTAKQLKYFGPGRRRRRRRTALAVNPHRRRSIRAVATPRRRSRRRHVTRLRRNPMRFSGGKFSMRRFLNDTLMPASVGAAGALGVNIALGYLTPSLPISLQSGLMNTGVKIAGAVAVGMAAGMVAGKRFGEQAMAGAITVTLYDLFKGYMQTAMPALPLHEYDVNMGWVSPGIQVGPQMSAYVGSDRSYSGMGMYVGESEHNYSYGND
jgi:hypothetical protein